MTNDFAEFITVYGSLGVTVARHFGGDVEQARAAFEGYAGEYYDAADFAEYSVREAEYSVRETGPEILGSLEQYIDWTRFARDMVFRGDIMVFQTGRYEVHVFWVISGVGN